MAFDAQFPRMPVVSASNRRTGNDEGHLRLMPQQRPMEAVTDEADLLEVHETERHLLYVACMRARDSLWVSGVEPESEFLRAMRG